MSLRQREIKVPGYEKVIKVVNDEVGLEAIIVMHDSRLGPALGGTRIFPYGSFEAALTDALRLAKGMTYKAAIAQTGTGGGKSVIIADPTKDKSVELLHAFGEAVDRLKGEYVCSEDVGCSVKDVAIIHQATKYVCGIDHEKGSGDPSPFTAYGVFRAIQATLKELDGSDSLKGKRIALQGLGKVGNHLIEHLFWAGAKLIICDIDDEKMHAMAHRYGATTTSREEILFTPCDILAPCALGGMINQKTIPKLKCRAVVGAANNQLLEEEDANRLAAKRIAYAPDFIVNSGGLINAVLELVPGGYNACLAREKVALIYDQISSIFNIARRNRVLTNEAATALVEYRLKYNIGRRIEPLCFPYSPDLLAVH